jgi:hypothetical protein
MKSKYAALAERVKVALLVAAVMVLTFSQFQWQTASVVSIFLAFLLALFLFLSGRTLTERDLREREYAVRHMDDSLSAGGLNWQVECQSPPYDGPGRLCWITEPLCPDCGQPMAEEGVVHPFYKCYGCHSGTPQKFQHTDSRKMQARKALAAKVRLLRREFRRSARSSAVQEDTDAETAR